MKKLFMIAAVLICSVSVAEAQSFKDLLKQAATKAATEAATQTITNATSNTTTTLRAGWRYRSSRGRHTKNQNG